MLCASQVSLRRGSHTIPLCEGDAEAASFPKCNGCSPQAGDTALLLLRLRPEPLHPEVSTSTCFWRPSTWHLRDHKSHRQKWNYRHPHARIALIKGDFRTKRGTTGEKRAMLSVLQPNKCPYGQGCQPRCSADYWRRETKSSGNPKTNACKNGSCVLPNVSR